MAYKSRLQTNNIDLSAILADINNLPPAGTEDISAELDAQTAAVNELLKVAKRKVAENNGEGEYVWEKYTSEGGDLVGYVVSIDITTYPEKGEQDGYWYELVKKDETFGTIGFEGELVCGTFTVPSDLTNLEDIVVYHNLNVIPKVGMIFKISGTHSKEAVGYLDRVVVFPYMRKAGMTSTDTNVSGNSGATTIGTSSFTALSAYGWSTKSNTNCICTYYMDATQFYIGEGNGNVGYVTSYYSSGVTYGWIVLA